MKFIIFLFVTISFFNAIAQSDIDYFIKSKIFEEKGQIDTSISLISEAIAVNPSQLYFKHRAQLFYNSKNVNKALIDFLQVNDSIDSDVKYKIASCYAINKKWDEAEIWLRKYLKTENKIPAILVKSDTVFSKFKLTVNWKNLWDINWYSDYENYITDIYYLSSKGLNSEIFDVVDSALKYFPNKDELWFWRAKAFKFGNNPKEEMSSVDKALKINPTRIDLLLYRANLLRKDGKSKKAIIDYSSVLTLQPWNIKCLKERGISKIEATDYNGAINDLMKCSSYDSEDGVALYYAGHAAFLNENLNQAIEIFSKAVKLNDFNSDSYFERGRCYIDQLKYDLAFSDLCMAVDLKPNNGEYFCYRGLAYFGLKNKLGACHDWEKAKSLDYPKAEEYLLRFCSDIK
ncbi:MAG: tetratricopeptide repeat protein [Bacteroidia bacterium]|nr:tetratricopeptide repeat protein [Bacteroidia bacterium]